jgi:hypothetical protein
VGPQDEHERRTYRIIEIILTLGAPGREIGVADRQGMVLLLCMCGHVGVLVPRAEDHLASKTPPVLLSGPALGTRSKGVDGDAVPVLLEGVLDMGTVSPRLDREASSLVFLVRVGDRSLSFSLSFRHGGWWMVDGGWWTVDGERWTVDGGGRDGKDKG